MGDATDGSAFDVGAGPGCGRRWRCVNRAGQLARAQQALSAFLGAAMVDARAMYASELVLEEWLTNAWRHGQADAPDALVLVYAEVQPGQVRLQFDDRGLPFDPTAVALPAAGAGRDVARPGGLGLLMMRRSVADWQHERIDDVNRLTVWIARGAASR